MQFIHPHSSSVAILFVAALAILLGMAPNSFAGSSDDTGGNSSNNAGVAPGKTFNGKATYYPNSLNSHETASGETFHQSGHTAASNKLPLGTDVKVTNLKTGKSTGVTVTDRGPALGSRRIDLSKKAAQDIGLTQKEGTAPVKVKVIHTTGEETAPTH